MRTAEAEAAKAAKDLERFTPLAASGTVSQQQLDAARAAAHTASSRRDAARDQLRLVREGARPQEIAAARAAVDTAQPGACGRSSVGARPRAHRAGGGLGAEPPRRSPAKCLPRASRA